MRGLIRLIERRARKTIYSDFEDEIGVASSVALAGITPQGTDFERFKAKARVFLRAHADRLALHKLHRNQPLTATDLHELEGLLIEAGASAGDLALVQGEAQNGIGLAIFVRSLVGLDRVAAQALFNEFLLGGRASASQIEFLDLLISHLTELGAMDESRLYEPPFIDISPTGPESLFGAAQADRLVAVLRELRQRAA